MKVVILCGGLGTRLREETEHIPKSMVEVGGKPLLWWIMKHYAFYGFKEFVLCLGYKGDVIRDYFLNYDNRNSDLTINLRSRERKIHDFIEEDWKITLAETGDNTTTGGRLVKVLRYLDDAFMLTYGDGLSNVNLHKLLKFHNNTGKYATVTAVRNISRFGELSLQDSLVNSFREKIDDSGFINGGFFVFEPEIWEYVGQGIEELPLETGLLSTLTENKQLAAFVHEDFWMCIDTFRELQLANDIYKKGNPPWIN